jgi:hypothetical protein
MDVKKLALSTRVDFFRQFTPTKISNASSALGVFNPQGGMATKNPLIAILSPQKQFKGVTMHNAACRPRIARLPTQESAANMHSESD